MHKYGTIGNSTNFNAIESIISMLLHGSTAIISERIGINVHLHINNNYT